MSVAGVLYLALIILAMIWLNIHLWLRIKWIEKRERVKPVDPASPGS